jgi:DNA (cytosine-5)-methyltransferase 1
MTLGVREACAALRLPFKVVLAVDTASHALKVYAKAFGDDTTKNASVSDLIDTSFGENPSRSEARIAREVGRLDILVAGPPCQGNSNLNNVTRRRDPKNELYERVARFAELTRPVNILVENVPDVLYDRSHVFERTFEELLALGYFVDHGVVDAVAVGVPQARKRHILLASLKREYSVSLIADRFRRRPRTVQWAIDDLDTGNASGVTLFDTASKASVISKKRIDYLFENKTYDLPDEQRPTCHKDREHSYKSVYGRLRWTKPAQTLTSGFGCTGQGRFVHPGERRTLTPHEAARLQSIPDHFSFDVLDKRTKLAEFIGNAVPPRLVYVFAVELLR